jgi:hypothetical protein
LNISAEYSWWLLLPAMLLAAAVAWWLYRDNPLKLENKYSKEINYGLSALRFVALTLIFILLIGPLINRENQFAQKPIIAVAVDHSSSILQFKDSAWYRTQLAQEVQSLKSALGDDYEVQIYGFGEKIKETFEPTYTDKITNIGGALREIAQRNQDKNLSAIVLASDGLYNQGIYPPDALRDVAIPIFTLLMGDTVAKPDLLIKQVKHNEVVFAGNNMMIQVDVMAHLLTSEKSILSIEHEGKTLATKNIDITSQRYFESHNFSIPISGDGMQLYTIKLTKAGNETNLINNSYRVYVNVISNKQQILVLAAAPHPDLGALKTSIEKNEGYSCAIMYAYEANLNNLQQYSMVILHQMPGLRGEGMPLVEKIKQRDLPILYVVGTQTGLNYLMQLEPTLKIQFRASMSNEVIAKMNEQFSLFNLSIEEQTTLQKMPPLLSPYATMTVAGEFESLMWQQIGNVQTNQPLWLFLKSDVKRVGLVFGEGIWRWLLADFKQSQQEHVPNLINKTIQYLSIRKDRSQFVIQAEPRFYENEPVVIEAERYNDSYELITDDEVSIVISNQLGKQYPYTFSKQQTRYYLRAGLMPPGKYTYKAKAERNGKTLEKTGAFTVVPLQLELMENVANAQLMYELAKSSGGSMLPIREMDKLVNKIKENDYVKPIITTQQEVKKWIDLKWLFILILLVLTSEWVIRKWNGSI